MKQKRQMKVGQSESWRQEKQMKVDEEICLKQERQIAVKDQEGLRQERQLQQAEDGGQLDCPYMQALLRNSQSSLYKLMKVNNYIT